MHGARLLGRLGAHAQTLMAVTVSSFARLHFTNELATAQKRFVSRLRRTQTKVGDARMRALLTARKVQACALRGESWKIAETTLDAGADGTDYRTKEMVLVEDDVKWCSEEVRGSMTTVVTGFDGSKNPVYKSFVDGVSVVKPFWDSLNHQVLDDAVETEDAAATGEDAAPEQPAGPRDPPGPRIDEYDPDVRDEDRVAPDVVEKRAEARRALNVVRALRRVRTVPTPKSSSVAQALLHSDADAAWRLLQQAHEADDPDAALRALVEPLDPAAVGATGDVPALVALLRDGLRERFDEEPAPRRQTLRVAVDFADGATTEEDLDDTDGDLRDASGALRLDAVLERLRMNGVRGATGATLLHVLARGDPEPLEPEDEACPRKSYDEMDLRELKAEVSERNAGPPKRPKRGTQSTPGQLLLVAPDADGRSFVAKTEEELRADLKKDDEALKRLRSAVEE